MLVYQRVGKMMNNGTVLGSFMSLQQGYHKMALFSKNWVFIRLSDKIKIPARAILNRMEVQKWG